MGETTMLLAISVPLAIIACWITFAIEDKNHV